MKVRLRKKILKKNKIFFREIIAEIDRRYDIPRLLLYITDQFTDNLCSENIQIAYVDFRSSHGTFENENVDTFSAYYDPDNDIIEFNISAQHLPYLKRLYYNHAMAVILDLFLHEWCHKIEFAFNNNSSLDDKLGVLTKLPGDHSERFEFIYVESQKMWKQYIHTLGYSYDEILVRMVGTEGRRCIPTLGGSNDLS